MDRNSIKMAPFGMGSGFGFGWTSGAVVVPTDGPSSWYRPTSSSHFTALGLNVPDWLALCQESSGNISPTIGSGAWTGTGALYSQTVTGWTANFVGFNGATNPSNFSSSF